MTSVVVRLLRVPPVCPDHTGHSFTLMFSHTDTKFWFSDPYSDPAQKPTRTYVTYALTNTYTSFSGGSGVFVHPLLRNLNQDEGSGVDLKGNQVH